MDNQDYMSLIEEIRSIQSTLSEVLKECRESNPEPYNSDEVNEIYAALSEAQSQFPAIVSSKVNQWFDTPYAQIFDITSAVYPILGEHGLAVIQQERIVDGGTVLYTRLAHKSGQWTESRLRVIPSRNDIDTFRSALNSLRGSSLLSILGIGIPDDPRDDDGQTEMEESRKAIPKEVHKNKVDIKRESSEVISKEQREELEYEMGDYLDLGEILLDKCHVRSLSDIPKSKFRNCIDFIRKNKKVRESTDS